MISKNSCSRITIMDVFGSSAAGETKKYITNLEINNNKMKNELSVLNQTVIDNKNSIKALEEIIKTLSNVYTKLDDTTELKNKIYIIESSVNYTEKYLSEVIALLHTRDSAYFKISSEATTKEEGRV